MADMKMMRGTSTIIVYGRGNRASAMRGKLGQKGTIPLDYDIKHIMFGFLFHHSSRPARDALAVVRLQGPECMIDAK